MNINKLSLCPTEDMQLKTTSFTNDIMIEPKELHLGEIVGQGESCDCGWVSHVTVGG